MAVKILHLIDYVNKYSGLSLSTVRMIVDLRKKGYQGEILCGSGTAISEVRQKGIDISFFRSFSKKRTPRNMFKLAVDINRYLKNNEIDQLHAHHRLLGLIGWFLAKWHGIPIVHYDHNILHGKKYFSYWGGLVIADSHQNRRHLNQYFKIKKERIITCHEFIELGELKKTPIRAYEGVSNIGTIGRLDEQKGHKYLIKAFKQYLNINPGATLTIKGSGPLKSDLQRLIVSLGLERKVFIEPPDHDIKSFFEKLDCFAISSIFEGTCMAAVEAAAYGLPILATNVGGLRDYLEDGTSAILVGNHSSGELLKGLKQLNKLPSEERLRLAQNARTSINTVFNREQQIQILAEAYKKAYHYA